MCGCRCDDRGIAWGDGTFRGPVWTIGVDMPGIADQMDFHAMEGGIVLVVLSPLCIAWPEGVAYQWFTVILGVWSAFLSLFCLQLLRQIDAPRD